MAGILVVHQAVALFVLQHVAVGVVIVLGERHQCRVIGRQRVAHAFQLEGRIFEEIVEGFVDFAVCELGQADVDVVVVIKFKCLIDDFTALAIGRQYAAFTPVVVQAITVIIFKGFRQYRLARFDQPAAVQHVIVAPQLVDRALIDNGFQLALIGGGFNTAQLEGARSFPAPMVIGLRAQQLLFVGGLGAVGGQCRMQQASTVVSEHCPQRALSDRDQPAEVIVLVGLSAVVAVAVLQHAPLQRGEEITRVGFARLLVCPAFTEQVALVGVAVVAFTVLVFGFGNVCRGHAVLEVGRLLVFPGGDTRWRGADRQIVFVVEGTARFHDPFFRQ